MLTTALVAVLGFAPIEVPAITSIGMRSRSSILSTPSATQRIMDAKSFAQSAPKLVKRWTSAHSRDAVPQ